MKTSKAAASILVLVASSFAITAVAGNHDGKASKGRYAQYVYEPVAPQEDFSLDANPNHRMHNQFAARDDDDTTVVTASPTLYPTYFITTDDDDDERGGGDDERKEEMPDVETVDNNFDDGDDVEESSATPTATSTNDAEPCTTTFTIATYDAIDADIQELRSRIDSSDEPRAAHFVGGIVRLAAHDFMDYDPSKREVMGSDGCYDAAHPNNAGLQSIWCTSGGCELTTLHETKYAHISRADFWIASANAVIRQTSNNNELDLIDTFRWGRRDLDFCAGSGGRLPTPARCTRVEDVFGRMGLSWRDTVALLGAHTLGRGSRNFSGHHGTWVDSNADARIFDKSYFSELLDNTWRMRNEGGPANGGPPQDWTTGRDGTDRMMLNTDICLAYDIDDQINGGPPCCTTTSVNDNECPIVNMNERDMCPMYTENSSRYPALESVMDFYDGNDANFYNAFSTAWEMATTVGQDNLQPLSESCN
jgi:hypothetical protein